MTDKFVKKALTLTAVGAKQVLAAAEQEAERNGWPLCIAVTDERGELMAFLRMEGALFPSADAAIVKARTAARVKIPSKEFAAYATAGNAPIQALWGLGPLEGGVPIIIDGVVVGGVGTSGAAAEEDVMASVAGAKAVGSIS